MGYGRLTISVVLFVALIQSIDAYTFYSIGCKGIYDKVGYALVDQMIEDCYNIFREPSLYSKAS